MLKKLLILAFAGLLSPAYGAGTIPYSLSQQLDEFGKPLAACKLYLIQAGTVSTPQNGYQDSALTLVLPNPMTCDASGRLPQFFLADGTIKVRLTKSNGVNVVTADGIQVVGNSSGGGGGGTVDPTTIMATGDIKARYSTGVLTGFVRANGRTIGSATSGATERANADAQALFEYLWGADSNLAVSTGRGASANADWVANKTIALPDWRGLGLGGLADMGNTATSTLTSTYFGVDPTVLGAAGGAQSQTLALSNLPNYVPSFAGINDPVSVTETTGLGWLGVSGTHVSNSGGTAIPAGLTSLISTGNFTPRGAVGSINGGVSQVAFSKTSPMKLATIYMKL